MSQPPGNPPLVLASSSPYRRALLDRIGVDYVALDHRADEDGAEYAGLDTAAVAVSLARAKAVSLVPDCPYVFILGSDQLVELDGEPIGKPHTRAGALDQLRRLRGRTHQIITAVALVHPDGGLDEAVDVHRMTMRDLSDEELERYVDADNPVDCAGSYKIESRGIALFESVVGDDFTAIEGLPMIRVIGMLRQVGFAIP